MEQIGIIQNKESGQEVAKLPGGRSREDVRWWQSRVFRMRYRQSGVLKEGADFSVRVQYQGRRECFNLGTPNKASAAERARNLYRHLAANGWDRTLEEFKPRLPRPSGPVVTAGDFLAALRATETGNPQTFEDYCQKFRLIVAAVAGIVGDSARFDYRTGGRQAWLAKVEAVSLGTLSPQKVRAWKKAFLDRAGSNRLKQRSARITVNSILRRASSLFSARRLRAAGLGISSPFEGVDLEPRQLVRYRSDFDIAKLTAAAQAELSAEEFKVYLLAAFAGLRRDEIDKLEWSAFRWDSAVLRLEVTEHFAGKSQESVADIDLEEEVLGLFRGFHAQAKGCFVIQSNIAPRRTTTYRHYRAKRTFDQLCAWLRVHGLRSRNPLHTLRKEYGSQITDRLGIFAASTALRHADIKVTAQHYVERKRRITPGLGNLLKQPGNISPLTPNQYTGEQKAANA